jgi:ribosomal protein S18 acetylase RimI-like enzyme
MTFTVEELVNEPEIAAFFEDRRLWSAYGLCDLDQPYRRHARFLGATSEGTIAAVVLVYAPPGFNGVLPFGDVGGVAAIFTASSELPFEAFLLVGEEHMEAVERRYRVARPWDMLRMAVNRTTFSPCASDRRIVRLSAADKPAIEVLYRAEPDSAFFDSATLVHGKHFGVYEAGALVAIAGTHAWSARYRIGAIGGVFTHPDFRGRGLGTATTGAVAQALIDSEVDDVVLNVRADNMPALRVYARLGFMVVRPYLEGQAVDRAGPNRRPSACGGAVGPWSTAAEPGSTEDSRER